MTPGLWPRKKEEVMRQAQGMEPGSDFSVPLLGPVTSLISSIPSTRTNVFNF